MEFTTIVNNMFNKSFVINDNENYILPKPESMFVDDYWEIEELQTIKKNLNEIKSKLNNFCFNEWHRYTSERNKAKFIERRIRHNFCPEFVTQAWCKFHEIISKYPVIPKERIFSNGNKFLSLHLCEAPGAFITCLNHWLKTNIPIIYWDWIAMTLNPYYEGNCNNKMISDDRFIRYTLSHWFFGINDTGNLMDIENLYGLIKHLKCKEKVYLITADGSVNCANDPGEQEKIVASLHFCEVVTALHILETGGNFVLKIFTMFEHESVCLIYFLSCIFKKIHFYKPVTSKEGNSEVYMICLDFKGLQYVSPYLSVLRNKFGKKSDLVMFKKSDIPLNFIKQIISCAQAYKHYQCQVIEDNIKMYHYGKETRSAVNKIADLVADKFMVDFPLQKLHMSLQILPNLKLRKTNYLCNKLTAVSESFYDKQKKQLIKPLHLILMYIDRLKFSHDTIPQIFVFNCDKLHINTCINIGRSFKNIQSSRFCTVEETEIFNLLFEIVDTREENGIFYLPNKQIVKEYETRLHQLSNDKHKTIYFQYNKIYNNLQIICLIEETLATLKNGDNLVLFGFLLLTQFNVGLIYLLTYTFDCLEFTTDKEIGYTITFKNFKHEEFILQEIKEIHRASQNAIEKNDIVVSIISIKDVYDSNIYSIILKLNNWIARFCVNYVHSICDEDLHTKETDLLLSK